MRSGIDYAWGHNSVQVFENEMKRLKKDFVGTVFAPTGTKDFSTYVTKIRQSGADGVYLCWPATTTTLSCPRRRNISRPKDGSCCPSSLELTACAPWAMPLSASSARSRYCLHAIDNPKNKEFVELWKQGARRPSPITSRASSGSACRSSRPASTKAGGTEADKLRPALEDLEIDDIKGKVHMRKCDHQGAQQGFMVKAVKKDGFRPSGAGDHRHLPGRARRRPATR